MEEACCYARLTHKGGLISLDPNTGHSLVVGVLATNAAEKMHLLFSSVGHPNHRFSTLLQRHIRQRTINGQDSFHNGGRRQLFLSSRVTGTAFSSFLLFDEDGVSARQAQKVLR